MGHRKHQGSTALPGARRGGPTYEELKRSVEDFFSDKSRSQTETKEQLEELSADIDIMIQSLDD